MTHTYNITGMTCNNCVETVKNALSKIDGITNANVNLEKNEAEITMHHHVNISEMQKALDGTKYKIQEKGHSMQANPFAVEEPRFRFCKTFKTYLPIILIFGYITLVTVSIQVADKHFDFMLWMQNFMAGFFLVFSFFKMLDIPNFAMSYSSYDIIAKRWHGFGYIYPFIELTLGILFLIQFNHFITNLATVIVMGVSSIGVIQSLIKKNKIQCACLGAVFNLPMSTITLIEDLLMVVMAGVILILKY